MTKAQHVAAVRRVAARLIRAKAELRDARVAVRQAIRDAHAAGVTLDEIGRELGVTRQRVAQLERGE